MATPYTVTVVLRKDGAQPKTVSMSSSDVAGEYWLFPSGASTQAFAAQPVYVTDIIVSSSGGTTKNFQIFVNGTSVIDTMPLANFVGTVVSRPINLTNPVVIPAGGTITFKQLA